MGRDHIVTERHPAETNPPVDQGAIRILQTVGDVERERRGRGPDFDEIVDLVIQGPLSRREVQGRPGAEIRVSRLVSLGYLRLDTWKAYHITRRGWIEGLGRTAEDITWQE